MVREHKRRYGSGAVLPFAPVRALPHWGRAIRARPPSIPAGRREYLSDLVRNAAGVTVDFFPSEHDVTLTGQLCGVVASTIPKWDACHRVHFSSVESDNETGVPHLVLDVFEESVPINYYGALSPADGKSMVFLDVHGIPVLQNGLHSTRQ